MIRSNSSNLFAETTRALERRISGQFGDGKRPSCFSGGPGWLKCTRSTELSDFSRLRQGAFAPGCGSPDTSRAPARPSRTPFDSAATAALLRFGQLALAFPACQLSARSCRHGQGERQFDILVDRHRPERQIGARVDGDGQVRPNGRARGRRPGPRTAAGQGDRLAENGRRKGALRITRRRPQSSGHVRSAWGMERGRRQNRARPRCHGLRPIGDHGTIPATRARGFLLARPRPRPPIRRVPPSCLGASPQGGTTAAVRYCRAGPTVPPATPGQRGRASGPGGRALRWLGFRRYTA